MSEAKLVSPLLDGFAMGAPMSSHDGIECCPAIRESTEEKYIVKIISVPASQKQLDALLLTGAYPDAASATEYFKDVAEGIVKEAELLKQLSKLEGFLAYDNWQIVPMEGNSLGYQVYLISPYKRSLEKHLRRSTMTRLGAVNLGIDLCTALSVCRRAGFMHVDLKPANIYLTGKNEYRIGDLGFAKLSALKYTSMPEKYCSRFTPPELHDPLNTLNPTADIYAVGMILYQIYNNGALPFDDKAPTEPLPAPLNADYELAEIILKACDPSPRNRWQTPIEMGQALVGYMKRNELDDTPIIPPVADKEYLDASFEPAEKPAPATDEATAEIPPEDDTVSEIVVEDAHIPGEPTEEETVPAAPVEEEAAPKVSAEEESISEAADDDESEHAPMGDELSALSIWKEDPESVPELNTSNWDIEQILNAVQEGPAVAVAESGPAKDEVPANAPKKPAARRRKRRKGGFLKLFISVVLLAALVFGGFYYYQNIYLLHIGSMELVPFENTITVTVDTESDESLLTVICTDSFGNQFSRTLMGGKACFEELTPGTLYKVELAANGFHDLKGYRSGTVSTHKETEITGFSYVNGTEDGTLVLSFSAEGDVQDWVLEYTADGEETQSTSFTGNSVTVSGLTVGKTYTFSLVTVPGADHYIVGTETVEIPIIPNVVAENPVITACGSGELTVQWDTPAGAVVESWNVRCYNDNGYDETLTVSETSATFTGIAAQTPYTVEVAAAGMSVNARTYISANPANITDIAVDDTAEGKLTVTWQSGGVMPEGGWLVLYTMGSGTEATVITTDENIAVIEPTVPGTAYTLTIKPADGSTVFGGSHTCSVAGATAFNANSISSASVTASLCPTPNKSNWTYKDIADGDYTATHGIGSRVSMVLYSPTKADRSNDEISVMFVIRDAAGNPLPGMTNIVRTTWNDLWNNRSRYASLDIPVIPGTAGEYTVEVYFDRQFVVSKALTVID